MTNKGLVEAYYSIYRKEIPVEVEITEELIDEIVDELVEELVEEGYAEEEAYSLVEEAADTYIDEAKVTFGHDTTARRASGAPVGARRKYGKRKAGEALKAASGAAKGAYKTAKAKAAGAAVDVAMAGSIAKKKAGEAKKAVQDAPGKAREAASGAKKKAKSGIKGFIKRQAEKVVKRMSEEQIAEAGKAFGGGKDPCWKGYKQVGMKKKNGKEVPNCVPTKEELEATGVFSEKEIEAIMEAEMSEGYKEIDSAKHGRMYDRYKKLRTAAMKDAAETGEASGDNRYKMGKMQSVISKSAENLRKKG